MFFAASSLLILTFGYLFQSLFHTQVPVGFNNSPDFVNFAVQSSCCDKPWKFSGRHNIKIIQCIIRRIFTLISLESSKENSSWDASELRTFIFGDIKVVSSTGTCNLKQAIDFCVHLYIHAFMFVCLSICSLVCLFTSFIFLKKFNNNFINFIVNHPSCEICEICDQSMSRSDNTTWKILHKSLRIAS